MSGYEFPMVRVTWRDATNLNENVWTPLDEIRRRAGDLVAYQAVSVGWLLEDREDLILIGQGWDPQRRNVTDVLAIQRCMVDSIEHLAVIADGQLIERRLVAGE